MISLGVRLALAGGRDAIARLALIAVAVAVGAALLLFTLAGLNGVQAQNARYAWLETAYAGAGAPPTASAPATDPLWWRLRADYFRGQRIGRIDLAATGARSPVPPGLRRLPGPGQYYASPALAHLIRTTPPAELADRYPGTLAGTIGDAGLPSPTTLIVVIGHRVDELSNQADADRIAAISTTAPSECGGGCALGVGIDANGVILILSVVAAALLFPVLMFIGGATRLSAARREQRFAAMRLVGATPRQISLISVVESAIATTAGVVLGFPLFYGSRPWAARIPFTGEPFFTRDLTLTVTDVLLVGLGVPVAAAVAARLALRRVNISPLGVTRRTTPRPPRSWRVIPLLGGLTELGYLAYLTDIGNSHKHSSETQAWLYLSGVLATMAGLVVAGPWLTMIGARMIASRSTRPATLIAARRLADTPQACFRAVSGLVLALFVGTCTLGIITSIVAHDGGSADGSRASASTVVTGFVSSDRPQPVAIPAPVMHALTSIDGVGGVTLARSGPGANAPTFAACAQLARTPALGRCAPGAGIAEIDLLYGGGVIDHDRMADATWPPADLSEAQLDELPIVSVAVGTDGSSEAVERVRTVLGSAFPATFAPQTLKEIGVEGARQVANYRQLAEVVILATLPIAGCSLAVNTVGGLADRKRPFSLLRLSGTPLPTLRRVITLETAAPLLISAAVSAGTALLTAQLFLHAQLHDSLQPPGGQYYLAVGAGLVGSLAVIASTMPLLRRITGPEAARND